MKKNITILLFSIIAFFPTGFAHAKSYWLIGALIGAGAGAGIGAGSMAAICSIPEGSCRNKAAGYAGFTLLGAGAGFGIGAAIGSAFKKKDVAQKADSSSTYFAPTLIADPLSNVYALGVGAIF